MSDPYIHSVLSLEGSIRRGHDIFQINCAACHGITGDGKVGPSLHRIAKRKSNFGLIHQVTDGKTPPMPMFQPTPQEMADLLEYLRQL
jgi:mono/diheme cytochrome c family protein